MTNPPRTAPEVWTQTASGRCVDLLAPTPHDIDLVRDVGEGLARIARFAGQCDAGTYSVAQHSVLGADQIFADTGSHPAAAYFLLHDGHEAFLGDLVKPATEALCRVMEAEAHAHGPDGAGLGKTFRKALASLKARLDRAIFEAAGLSPEMPKPIQFMVEQMDLRMLRTERDRLLATPPFPWSPAIELATPLRLRGKLKIWPWPDAADQFRDRLRLYCPKNPVTKRKA